MPDIDAAQLLRSLGLEGAADPVKLLSSLRKLPGVRQQGVLDSATTVAAHLCSPAVGLTQQQVGQLLQGCPNLFSWPPEQRAAVLFGELMGVGLAAERAAQCLNTVPVAAGYTSFTPGLAELAAILAHSQDSRLAGPPPKVPAAQRTVAALLQRAPSAVRLVTQRAGYLQHRAAELQQARFTPADVAALAWARAELLLTDSAARVARAAAVLRQELGLTAAEVVSLVVKGKPAWVGSSENTLRERAAALAEVGAALLLPLRAGCLFPHGQQQPCMLPDPFSCSVLIAGLWQAGGRCNCAHPACCSRLPPCCLAAQPALHGGLWRARPHSAAPVCTQPAAL